LLRLHSLLTKRIDEPRTRLVVHRLDESETASGRIRYAAIAMKRDQTLAGDDFEPVLVAAADVAAVDADEQRAIRGRVARAGPLVERYARRRRGELRFVRFSDPEEMPPDPLGADRSLEREQFAQQSDRQAVGNQRGEFGLQIQHLRTDAFAQQLRQRAHRARRPLGARTGSEPLTVEPQGAKWRPEHDMMAALERTPVATVGAGALIGVPLRDLSASFRAEPATVDPDDLVDISSVAGLVDENDLYCHSDHGEPRAIVNACRNAALLKAGEKPSVRKGSRAFRRDTARSKSERSSGSSRTVASPSLTRRRTATTASTSSAISQPTASRRRSA